jgi:hypothetical protein
METEVIEEEKALDWWRAKSPINPDRVAIWCLEAVVFLYKVSPEPKPTSHAGIGAGCRCFSDNLE